MLYAKIVNDEVVEWPLTEDAIQWNNTNISFPENPTVEDYIALGYTPIRPKVIDIKPTLTHDVRIIKLVKNADGVWEREYGYVEITDNFALQSRLNIKWSEVRNKRNRLLAKTDGRVLRYFREVQLGLTPSEDINILEQYRQELADITNTNDPYSIVWPEEI